MIKIQHLNILITSIYNLVQKHSMHLHSIEGHTSLLNIVVLRFVTLLLKIWEENMVVTPLLKANPQGIPFSPFQKGNEQATVQIYFSHNRRTRLKNILSRSWYKRCTTNFNFLLGLTPTCNSLTFLYLRNWRLEENMLNELLTNKIYYSIKSISQV